MGQRPLQPEVLGRGIDKQGNRVATCVLLWLQARPGGLVITYRQTLLLFLQIWQSHELVILVVIAWLAIWGAIYAKYYYDWRRKR